MSVIICNSTCWPCKFGQCHEPAQPHPWWDRDDIEHAEATDQPAPEGNCACPCAKPADADR